MPLVEFETMVLFVIASLSEPFRRYMPFLPLSQMLSPDTVERSTLTNLTPSYAPVTPRFCIRRFVCVSAYIPYSPFVDAEPGGSITVAFESAPRRVIESLSMFTPTVSVPFTVTNESYRPASMKIVSPAVATDIAFGMLANGVCFEPLPLMSEPVAYVYESPAVEPSLTYQSVCDV